MNERKREAAMHAAREAHMAHVHLQAAADRARTARLPRAARLDKLAAQTADLRDYFAELGKKV